MGVHTTYPDLGIAQRNALLRLWGEIEDAVAGLERPLDMIDHERSRVDSIEKALRGIEFRVAFMFPEMRLWPEPFDHITPRGNVIWVEPEKAPECGGSVTTLRADFNRTKDAYRRVHKEYRDRKVDEGRKKRKAEKRARKAK